MRTYFKIRAIVDPSSIEELTYLDDEETVQVFSALEEGFPEVTLLCSVGDDEEVEIHNINDKPIVHNSVIELYGGSVTSESKFQ